MRGRKATPTPLKVLRMTSRKAEKLMNRQIPTPGNLIDPPEQLSPEQKLEWAYAIENAPKNVLKKIDKSILAGFIISADVYRVAAMELSRMKLLVKTPTQQLPMQNPYLPIMNRQFMLMMRAASELGFTPASRARIESSQKDPQYTETSWDELEHA